MESKTTNSLKPLLMQTGKMPLICFLFSAFCLQEKMNYGFFSVKFSFKIYRYVPTGYCVALDSVSFWDVENSKDQSWGSFS